MKKLYLIFALVVLGCARIHIACPENGSTTVAVGGSTVGLQLLAMGATAGRVAGFMAPAPAPSTAASYVDYAYLPIFGSDSVSCNSAPAPVPSAASTPTIIVVPAGPPAPTILKSN